uniref:Uncharacterized protein n=1 Tax=Candidatus Kentrum sp. TUN TaxID=2126343 RepID=A0A450ZLZ6_9GAMM|nr:MAG: hypothetical protein BECKTUN1418F_GA0071002_10558 [Candidatus Kentron sp. TUN]VFK55852.1 MAG: hypothetical protein BECKTUN1418D_GA0071000_10387 [Candidatus Kentron sp. TUN]VFK59192.1 MAG: hypothetical protein BECKTUN1418E_GA0071001_10528 [Candidatus Kentron sp. TUN]
MEIAVSITGIPIRFIYERWCHVAKNHDNPARYFHEVLETVEKSKAIKRRENYGKKKWMVAMYRKYQDSSGSSLHIGKTKILEKPVHANQGRPGLRGKAGPCEPYKASRGMKLS